MAKLKRAKIKCDICGKVCANERGLRTHFAHMHKQPTVKKKETTKSIRKSGVFVIPVGLRCDIVLGTCEIISLQEN